jgi:hypothetical protein
MMGLANVSTAPWSTANSSQDIAGAGWHSVPRESVQTAAEQRWSHFQVRTCANFPWEQEHNQLSWKGDTSPERYKSRHLATFHPICARTWPLKGCCTPAHDSILLRAAIGLI